ncbi:MAG: P-II family nitrogen regulator [Candidatus Tectimicrobiota bacterium]
MRLVRCYINPDKVAPLKEALFAQGIASGISAKEVMGIGKPMGQARFREEAASLPKFNSMTQIDMVLEAKHVEELIETVVNVCRTGALSDGKIFVLPVEKAVRIRTGERNRQALY